MKHACRFIYSGSLKSELNVKLLGRKLDRLDCFGAVQSRRAQVWFVASAKEKPASTETGRLFS